MSTEYDSRGSPGDPEATSRMWSSIPPQVHATARLWFKNLNRHDGDFGFITERTMIPFMLETGLNRSVLNKIWHLANIDENGLMTLEGFTIALHLMYEAQAGRSLPRRLWRMSSKRDHADEQAHAFDMTSRFSYEYDSDDGIRDLDDHDSDGGGVIYDPDNVFNRRWGLSSNTLPISIRRAVATSFPITATTHSNHTSGDYSQDDDVHGANNTRSERWDPFSGSKKKILSASGRRPFTPSVKQVSHLNPNPGHFDSDDSIRDPGDGFRGRWDQTPIPQSPAETGLSPFVRHSLTFITPSASPNFIRGSDARTRSLRRHRGGDVPNSSLTENMPFVQLQDSVVPDITHEIYNKILLATGGYSWVFCADWKKFRGDSFKVAVKILRMPFLENEYPEKPLKRLKREARVWKSLNHPNIAPLIGLVSGESGLGLVSPWYSHGNILQYLQQAHNVQREPLCEDVANGLRYLHEQAPSIVHGDLKGANILVGQDGHAVLCDFGLSMVLDSGPTGFTSSVVGGTLRFMAPEQFADDQGGKSIQSDVYSYACTYAEIMTGDPPFSWHRIDARILQAISQGEFPYKISSIVSRHSLKFLERGWAAEPASRPSMSEICQTLGLVVYPPSGSRYKS